MRDGIKFRIMSRLVVVTLAVLVSFSLILYYLFYSRTLASLSQRCGYEAQKNLLLIQSAVENAYQLGEILTLSEEVAAFLDGLKTFSPTGKTVAAAKLMGRLNASLPSRKYIHSFCIVSDEGETFWSLCPYDSFFKDWFAQRTGVALPSASPGFTACYPFPSHGCYYVREDLVSCISNRYQVVGRQFAAQGQIVTNLNFSLLMEDLFSSNSLFDQLCILNSQNRILYRRGDEKLAELAPALDEGFQKRKNRYYQTGLIESGGWKVVFSMDPAQLRQAVDFPFPYAVAGVILLALCLLFTFVFPLLLRISSEIVALDSAIARVANGDLETTVHLGGARELRNIAIGFNVMVDNTRRYTQESIAGLRERQKLRLELLLAKINPHFIYNTLNSVIYLARSGKDREIIDLTAAFIHLLQDSIHPGQNSLFETVRSELRVVDSYIVIQNCRYAGRFTFARECVPELLDRYIPKNMLQPLIENAILHGVCPRAEPGHIRLELALCGDQAVISIADDGVGMDREKAAHILEAQDEGSAKPPQMRHIGLSNIAQRLDFIFPQKHAFTIQSRPGQGTRVEIRLPIVDTPDYPDGVPLT